MALLCLSILSNSILMCILVQVFNQIVIQGIEDKLYKLAATILVGGLLMGTMNVMHTLLLEFFKAIA